MRKCTSIQALIGFIMWLSFFLAIEVNQIERLLLFAMLVIVPLILNVIETRNRNGDMFKTYIFSVYLYPIAALLACLSFFFSTGITAGLLSLGWLIWTAMVFLYGASRLLARALYLIEEVSIDIGLMYLLLGGAWFSTFRFGIDVMSFVLNNYAIDRYPLSLFGSDYANLYGFFWKVTEATR
ncbi:YndJ family protein [Priestia flexa]|nr:YndJ family protein [Priestia flexa]